LFERINPIPRHCVTFHNKLVFYGEELLALCPTPKLEDNLLSAVMAYSIYSQLTSICGGYLIHPPPKDAPCCGDRDSHNMATTADICKYMKFVATTEYKHIF
jgi:hypothetical protein